MAPAQMRVRVWMTIHLCSKELVEVSRMVKNISLKNTSRQKRDMKCQKDVTNTEYMLFLILTFFFRLFGEKLVPSFGTGLHINNKLALLCFIYYPKASYLYLYLYIIFSKQQFLYRSYHALLVYSFATPRP